jgi:hypothetical protein
VPLITVSSNTGKTQGFSVPSLDTSLDALRRIMADFMGKDDRFLTKEGGTLEDTTIETKVSDVIKDGALKIAGKPALEPAPSPTPKSDSIILVFGEDARVVAVNDLKAGLDSIRRPLAAAGVISSSDVFLSKGLTEISPEDEKSKSIGDACKKDGETNFVIVRRKPKSAIVVVNGANKVNLNIDATQALAALRAELPGQLMTSADSFQGLDGRPIPQAQEAGRQIRDALDPKTNTVTIASRRWT